MSSSDPGMELERLRALLDDLDIVVWEADASTYRPRSVGGRAGTVLGHDARALLERPSAWIDGIHADDRERVVAALGEPAHDLTYRVVRPDGRDVWVRSIGHLVEDRRAGAVVRGVLLDVTLEHEEDERRAEVEGRYRRLVEQLPGMVYLETVEPHERVPGDLLYISPQVDRILGFSPDGWTREPAAWKERIHEDDRLAVRAAYRDAMAAGGVFRADYRLLASDGSVVWIHAEAVLVHDEDGTPRFWQGVMLDTTERMRAEIQLREAEERYRALVEQTPAVTYIDDLATRRTIYISPQAERLLGYPISEFTGSDPLWPWILHPDDRERVLERAARASETEAPFDEEYRLVTTDGRAVWVHDEAVLIRDDAGRPRYWQGVWIDITERKRALELEHALELERREAAELRALDEVKNTFLQAVSHDLRTPLAAILGLAVTIERQHVGGDEAADLASRIAVNARKLDRMVTDLLDMDRLSRGIVEPKLEPTDVGALVARMVRDTELLADREVTVDVEETVSSVDVPKLERIVENLLVNAVRHTPPDARIWVSVRARDHGVDIAVEDDGPGVPEDQREVIFQPFRQASVTEGTRGFGIGLALVARFAELHRGHAWVEERPGGGASFHVWLPADAGADAATGT